MEPSGAMVLREMPKGAGLSNQALFKMPSLYIKIRPPLFLDRWLRGGIKSAKVLADALCDDCILHMVFGDIYYGTGGQS